MQSVCNSIYKQLVTRCTQGVHHGNTNVPHLFYNNFCKYRALVHADSWHFENCDKLIYVHVKENVWEVFTVNTQFLNWIPVEKLYSRMFRCGRSNRFKDLSSILASAAVHHWMQLRTNTNKTAELSQRRPRDAPNIWVPWKVLKSPH